MPEEDRVTFRTSGERPDSAGRAVSGSFKQAILHTLRFSLAKVPGNATPNDWYHALALTVRDRLAQQWIDSIRKYTEEATIVGYLSAEYLNGPQLAHTLVNLGIYEEVALGLEELGLRLSDLLEWEEEPGLGFGAKGEVASSLMDSLATLEIPAIGYGLRYEFGPFRQEVRDGWQVEMTDRWTAPGNPWEIRRPEIAYTIQLGGTTQSYYDERDCFRVRWIPKFAVRGTAYDMPIPGYRSSVTNLLRLWRAEVIDSFDYESFRSGDYFSALNEKIASESISKILYPDDEPYAGKQLRLAQQYFFVSCALQDMIRLHLLRWKPIHDFAGSFAIHLNDTPPVIAVAELMRLLVDEHLVSWDKAWYITQNAFSCTSYATLPETLEKWPVPLFANILPRHLEIVYEINRRFLDEIWLTSPSDGERASQLSLIDESDQKYVRMTHLGILGSHAVSAVSEAHGRLLASSLFGNFHALYPERFFRVAGGVSPRRWIAVSNPELARLISSVIGDEWMRNPQELEHLAAYASDPHLMEKWRALRRECKCRLAATVAEKTRVKIDPDTLFDVQIKRIHESNRQLLNLLRVIALYERIRENPREEVVPRTYLFAGKASPGYFMAHLIVKLIHAVAHVINSDATVAGRLTVVFYPDLNVKQFRKLCPVADLSEQIATAGKDVAGLGAMKLSMNGALTIGSRNGPILDIARKVGEGDAFLFGLSAEEVASRKAEGYAPMDIYRANGEIRKAIDLIRSGFFSREDVTLFKPLVDSLLNRDEHMVLADYEAYRECQEKVSALWNDKKKWTKLSIRTVAGMGAFSSDHAAREYSEKIWHAVPSKKGRPAEGKERS